MMPRGKSKTPATDAAHQLLAIPAGDAANQLDDDTMDALATWLRNVRSARITPADRRQVTPRFKTGK